MMSHQASRNHATPCFPSPQPPPSTTIATSSPTTHIHLVLPCPSCREFCRSRFALRPPPLSISHAVCVISLTLQASSLNPLRLTIHPEYPLAELLYCHVSIAESYQIFLVCRESLSSPQGGPPDKRSYDLLDGRGQVASPTRTFC